MSVLDRFRLDGRTAIVTGTGPGVGAHVARAYAELGANVVCASRSEENVQRLAGEICAAGGRAIGVATDVSVAADLENLGARTREAFGPVHILFNNAAAGVIDINAGPWGNDDSDWELAMNANVMAPYRLTRMLMPDMEQHGKGSIINVESCGGFTPILPSIAYGTSKAALMFLTRALAKACAPHARVNALCVGSMSPDGVELEIHKGYKLAERNAIKRIGAADEAVGTAILLASDASSYTTGSCVFVEGGRVGTVA